MRHFIFLFNPQLQKKTKKSKKSRRKHCRQIRVCLKLGCAPALGNLQKVVVKITYIFGCASSEVTEVPGRAKNIEINYIQFLCIVLPALLLLCFRKARQSEALFTLSLSL